MDPVFIYACLVLLGLCFGSYAGATVWRLRANSQKQDKKLNKLTKTSIINDRSICLNCSYKLRWYDLIPIISWISLGGKCRKCKKPIGYFEPLIEIGIAAYFVLSYAFWPYPLNNGFEITRLVLWLIACVPLAISFAYDMKWSLLDRLTSYVLIIIGTINALIVLLISNNKIESLLSIIGSIVILSGLYYLLNKVSRGKWVGDGDYVLALGLALLLADFRLAYVALFMANFVGCLIVLPGIITRKLKRNSRIPFGPLLIIGFFIAGLAGNYLLDIIFYGIG